MILHFTWYYVVLQILLDLRVHTQKRNSRQYARIHTISLPHTFWRGANHNNQMFFFFVIELCSPCCKSFFVSFWSYALCVKLCRVSCWTEYLWYFLCTFKRSTQLPEMFENGKRSCNTTFCVVFSIHRSQTEPLAYWIFARRWYPFSFRQTKIILSNRNFINYVYCNSYENRIECSGHLNCFLYRAELPVSSLVWFVRISRGQRIA